MKPHCFACQSKRALIIPAKFSKQFFGLLSSGGKVVQKKHGGVDGIYGGAEAKLIVNIPTALIPCAIVIINC